MVEQARSMFSQMNPELGDFFSMMADKGYLDLETRDGKAGRRSVPAFHRSASLLYLPISMVPNTTQKCLPTKSATHSKTGAAASTSRWIIYGQHTSHAKFTP